MRNGSIPAALLVLLAVGGAAPSPTGKDGAAAKPVPTGRAGVLKPKTPTDPGMPVLKPHGQPDAGAVVKPNTGPGGTVVVPK